MTPASLRSRILLIMIAAVVPAAIFVGVFAYFSYEAARRGQVSAVERNADLLLSRLDTMVLAGTRTAATLASFGTFAEKTPDDCSAKAGEMLHRYDSYSAFALIRGTQIWCEAHEQGALSLTDVLGDANAGAVAAPAAIITRRLPGGRFVVITSASGAGASAGPAAGPVAVALLISDAYVAGLLAEFRTARTSTAALAAEDGRVVIAPRGADAGTWPVGGFKVSAETSTFSGTGGDGRDYIYTASKLPSADLWLVTAQRESDLLGASFRQFAVTVLGPLIVMLAAATAIWIGLHGSVLRWVAALTRATRAYGAGKLASRIGDTSSAPAEFAELAQAFDRLADDMAGRTKELESEVTLRTAYIREIHHRVKNNLQVIGSLLALQKRELDPRDRAILRFPEDRINALSAAYRASYAVSEIGHVAIGNVIREVAHRLQGGGEGGHATFNYTFSGDNREVDLDTAVSIAMLMAEIVPPYADAGARNGHAVRIDLTASDDTLQLTIRGSPDAERQMPNLSRRFVQAYLRQLGATLDDSAPGETRIVAPFPVLAHRHA